MNRIQSYIANSTGKLDPVLDKINFATKKSINLLDKELNAETIDIIFSYAPEATIPELGIGANSPGPYIIYVAIDPNFKNLDEDEIVSAIMHEGHHCMRWRNPGYGTTLGEAIISEGLACLFEEGIRGKAPIYSQVNITDKEIKKAREFMDSNKFDHSEWFFGSKDISRWFGYSYGYKLCKAYSEKTGKTAADLVNVDASRIIYLGSIKK